MTARRTRPTPSTPSRRASASRRCSTGRRSATTRHETRSTALSTTPSPSGWRPRASRRRDSCENRPQRGRRRLRRVQLVGDARRADAALRRIGGVGQVALLDEEVADRVMRSLIDHHVQDPQANWYWNYSTVEDVPNDLTHAGYIVDGIANVCGVRRNVLLRSAVGGGRRPPTDVPVRWDGPRTDAPMAGLLVGQPHASEGPRTSRSRLDPLHGQPASRSPFGPRDADLRADPPSPLTKPTCTTSTHSTSKCQSTRTR